MNILLAVLIIFTVLQTSDAYTPYGQRWLESNCTQIEPYIIQRHPNYRLLEFDCGPTYHPRHVSIKECKRHCRRGKLMSYLIVDKDCNRTTLRLPLTCIC